MTIAFGTSPTVAGSSGEFLTCPFCAELGYLRLSDPTKKGGQRPYWPCGDCHSMVYLNSEAANAGFGILSGYVAAMGRDSWRATLASLAQGEVVEQGKSPMACPLCAAWGRLGITKPKNPERRVPYWSCPGCKAKIYLNLESAAIAFGYLSGMVASIGREAWYGRVMSFVRGDNLTSPESVPVAATSAVGAINDMKKEAQDEPAQRGGTRASGV